MHIRNGIGRHRHGIACKSCPTKIQSIESRCRAKLSAASHFCAPASCSNCQKSLPTAAAAVMRYTVQFSELPEWNGFRIMYGKLVRSADNGFRMACSLDTMHQIKLCANCEESQTMFAHRSHTHYIYIGTSRICHRREAKIKSNFSQWPTCSNPKKNPTTTTKKWHETPSEQRITTHTHTHTRRNLAIT